MYVCMCECVSVHTKGQFPTFLIVRVYLFALNIESALSFSLDTLVKQLNPLYTLISHLFQYCSSVYMLLSQIHFSLYVLLLIIFAEVHKSSFYSLFSTPFLLLSVTSTFLF